MFQEDDSYSYSNKEKEKENEKENEKSNKDKLKSNDNYNNNYNDNDNINDFINSELSIVKKNFKHEKEFDENSNFTEKELRDELDYIELQLYNLQKKNKKPIDFILDRFCVKEEILIKTIKIFENSMEEVINNMKNYFEDTIYFQFKIAGKFKDKNKDNIKKI